MSKTLYVTDLDGTLMNSSRKISDFTAETINRLVSEGMTFAYATARSNITASKITENITVSVPAILYNGSFILDNKTGELMLSNYFTRDSFEEISDMLFENGILPIVYSYLDGVEKFSYIDDRTNLGLQAFLNERMEDIRRRQINDRSELYPNNTFYFTCIDDEEKLFPVYQKLREKYSCVYQKDIYSDHQWLEIMPYGTNKANAIKQLKILLGCDRIVAFGDGKNDIPMFELADECYAVENAHEKLKELATAVIASNEDDGVARWLLENAHF